MIQAVQDTISLQDVGAISAVDIPMSPGTIVVLVGDNGAGKSTAISAVVSAIDGKNRGLKPRDGKMSGKARMAGATVSFGARMKRTETGETSHGFVVVEDGSGIAQILRPGIKDVKAADKKRLEGVLEVIGATLPIEKQREFLGEHYAGFAESRDVADAGFVDTVKAMKLYLEGVARTHTMKVDEYTGAIHQIGDIPEDVVVTVPVESLASSMAELAVETRDATKAREAADKALLALDSAGASVSVVEVEARITTTRSFIAETEQKIRDLQESLSEAKLILTRNEAIVETERAADSRRASLRAAIDTAPTLEAISGLTARLAEVTTLHTAAVLSAGGNSCRAKQRVELASLKSKREFSEATRDSIKETVYRLPELLHTAMESVPGWKVDEEFRLCVDHKRGCIPFSELSPGEGTGRVCLLACQFAKFGEGEVPVVGLPQECWEGLDGKNRRLLLESVGEHGLCVVTAQASGEDDEISGIRVKVLS